ncbi:MAG: 4Fe-4S dicluster domain-containing protein [Dehalococcoidales bacterium]|nr:4Fe-4S dicluster domain-containing protein [Dehalococcoidales bacterium]
MSEEKEKNPGKLSRRQFLKSAGIVVGSSAVGTAFLLTGCGKETEITKTLTQTTTAPGATVTSPPVTSTTTVTSPPVTTTTTKTVTPPPVTITKVGPAEMKPAQGYIVVDSKNCAGCQACMMACSMVHEGKAQTSLSRIQPLRNNFGDYPEDNDIMQCRQCVFPACVAACPTGACHIDTANGNVRKIDQSICIGCQQCIQACPYTPARVQFNFEKLKAQKCDLCVDTPYWLEEGGANGKQACVMVCPEHAIRFVTDIPSQVKDFGYDLT